ncbi:YihY/virulence factor BrkB family protein [Demequina silvatica]|uniref:YihY/virulence factor BrkB family protein n=1 Tax=Demequina silvatica TaxID=1638988 RepID=UPI0007825048|nr:YihY/virulence factor BrkB family protein [Demequina silvatica]
MTTDDVKAKAVGVVERGKGLKAWWDGSSWGRGLKRFSVQNGNVLSAGIAYFSLASVAAGIVVATTLATVFLAGNDELRDSLVEYLSEAVPGLIAAEPGGTGLIQPDDLGSGSATTVAGVVGIVSFLILINTATRFIAGLRTSTRTMLGNEVASPVLGKLRDVVALVALAVIAFVGLAIQVVASSAARAVADAVGLTVPTWEIRLIGYGAGLVADMLYVALVLMLLGGARLSWRVAWIILVAAVAIGVLRIGVTFVVSGTTDSKVLAPFAAIITLMIFVDYVNRFILMGAAWLGAHHREHHQGQIHPDSVEPPTVTVAGRKGRLGTPVSTARATLRNPEAPTD